MSDFAERLLALQEAAESIQARAEAEKRDLTPAERYQLDSILANFDQVENSMSAPGNRKTDPQDPDPPPAGHLAYRAAGNAGGNWLQATGTTGANGERIRAACMQSAGGQRPYFDNLGEFMNALASGREDRRLIPSSRVFNTGMNEGTGSEGGYIVPPQFMADILGGAFVESGILSRVTFLPMSSSGLAVGGFDTLNHTGGAIGGLSLKWTAEGSQLNSQTPTLRQINLVAKKGSIMVDMTSELLMDAPSATVQLQQVLTDAARYGLEAAVLTGTGAGQPLGILNDPALISVAKEGSQVADTITYRNVKSMLARIHPNLSPGSIFIANPTALDELLEMNYLIPNAAGSDYVGGQQVPVTADGDNYRLLGKPVVFSEALPTLGDHGDIILVNPREYVLGMRREASIDVSTHLKFDYDKVVFRLILRVDGQGRWNAPMTPHNGNTLSWCTSVAERS